MHKQSQKYKLLRKSFEKIILTTRNKFFNIFIIFKIYKYNFRNVCLYIKEIKCEI